MPYSISISMKLRPRLRDRHRGSKLLILRLIWRDRCSENKRSNWFASVSLSRSWWITRKVLYRSATPNKCVYARKYINWLMSWRSRSSLKKKGSSKKPKKRKTLIRKKSLMLLKPTIKIRSLCLRIGSKMKSLRGKLHSRPSNRH